jgi:hypothetical protein
MPDDIAERTSRLETWQLNHCPCIGLVRLEAKYDALADLVDKYVELHNFRNDIVAGRVTDLEKAYSGMNAKVTALITVGMLVVGGLIAMAFEMLKGGIQ